jgi:acyl dehydratase
VSELELPAYTFRVTRSDLVRYAGASGDFNPIHWSDRVATAVGLPGVIAHGMYTMALVTRAVIGWTGDPAAVLEVKVRFTRPVAVPDTDDGTELVVTGVVKASTDEGYPVIELTATCQGEKVISQARATVRALPAPVIPAAADADVPVR